MASKFWHCHFTTGEDVFVAYGSDRDRMRVYELPDGYKTKMFFPACTRFLYDVELIAGPERTMTVAEIRSTFGLE